MNYADIKIADVANGEGVRVSLFVSGCNHHCKGCFNAQAWDFNYGKEFTEEDIENAKKGIISEIRSIDDEQDTEITYFLGQELTNSKTSLDQYVEKIEKVTKKDIVDVANSVSINTVYFLKDLTK